MKLLVFAHRLELGGTQINAIELAAQLRDAHGFDVTLHATAGPALKHLRTKKMGYIPAPDARFHPSPARMRTLRAVVRRERPDLVHAWDWWQGLEAYAGVHLPMGVPLVISDMMMELTPAMPREVPTTFGFEDLRDAARRAGWRRTHLLLPPVDTVANAPAAADGRAFRAAHRVSEDEILMVSVSRLAEVMKSESLVRSIHAMSRVGREVPLKLVIVGDGEARVRLQALADAVNGELGREAVLLTGALEDPRPAYDAADIVLGMGGSVLRGLAFGKPAVVLGETGFARLFSPGTADGFLRTGMYGHGDGQDTALLSAIRELATGPGLRHDLGSYGRDWVVAHHGLGRVAANFARFCEQAVAARPSRSATALDAARTAFWYLRQRRFRVASRDRIVASTAQPLGQDPLRP